MLRRDGESDHLTPLTPKTPKTDYKIDKTHETNKTKKTACVRARSHIRASASSGQTYTRKAEQIQAIPKSRKSNLH
jgi:hypothetical protein